MVVHHVEVDEVAPRAITARTSSPSRAKSAKECWVRCGIRFRIMGPEYAAFSRATIIDAGSEEIQRRGHRAFDLPPDQSDEEEDRYVFAYTIRITNNGNVPRSS
jgi:hypothetical protein